MVDPDPLMYMIRGYEKKKTSKNPHLETDLWKVIQFHEGEKDPK